MSETKKSLENNTEYTKFEGDFLNYEHIFSLNLEAQRVLKGIKEKLPDYSIKVKGPVDTYLFEINKLIFLPSESYKENMNARLSLEQNVNLFRFKDSKTLVFEAVRESEVQTPILAYLADEGPHKDFPISLTLDMGTREKEFYISKDTDNLRFQHQMQEIKEILPEDVEKYQHLVIVISQKDEDKKTMGLVTVDAAMNMYLCVAKKPKESVAAGKELVKGMEGVYAPKFDPTLKNEGLSG